MKPHATGLLVETLKGLGGNRLKHKRITASQDGADHSRKDVTKISPVTTAAIAKYCCRRYLSHRPAPRTGALSDSSPGLTPAKESVLPALDGMLITVKSYNLRPMDTRTGCALPALQSSFGLLKQQRFERAMISPSRNSENNAEAKQLFESTGKTVVHAREKHRPLEFEQAGEPLFFPSHLLIVSSPFFSLSILVASQIRVYIVGSYPSSSLQHCGWCFAFLSREDCDPLLPSLTSVEFTGWWKCKIRSDSISLLQFYNVLWLDSLHVRTVSKTISTCTAKIEGCSSLCC